MRIVLAHGVFGFGVLGPLEYFNGVKSHLRATFGAEVITASVPPIGSVAERGQRLAERIFDACPTGEKVHILAHSMGGLDARWALKNVPRFAERVQTLVTIGTPHHGSVVADVIRKGDPAFLHHIPMALRFELEINQPALHDLTTGTARQFDVATPDIDGLNYIYIAGDIRAHGAHESRTFRSVQKIFGELDSHNDGVVTVSSATRGGTRKLFATWPVDHAGEIGWNLDKPVPVAVPFSDRSHLARYDEIVKAL